MATAISDENGFIEIKNNKLSKPGVFAYLGSEIGADEPSRVYKVFRPPSELRDPACAESFKLSPWVIDHKMLGKKYDSPAEEKGIHGVIGEEVYYDETDGWLKGNIKIFSDTLENAIADGKDELSLGFGCIYELGVSGTYEGEPYEAVQRNIRGNHLASVDDSRMDVAVMDHAMDTMTVFLNKTGDTKVDKKTVKSTVEGDALDEKALTETVKTITTSLESLTKQIAAMDSKLAALDEKSKGKDEEKDDDDDGMDMEKGKGKDKEKSEDEEKKSESKDTGNHDGMDAAIEKAFKRLVKPLVEQVSDIKKSGMDAGSLMKAISERDEMASQISNYVGVFDHQSMTLQDVAAYGIEKLKVPCEKGSEVTALKAYMHNRSPSTNLYTPTPIGQDGVSGDNPLDKYLSGGNA